MMTLTIKRPVIEALLAYAQGSHPREAILLLRGKSTKEQVTIEEVMIPPLATHGHGFSSFSPGLLPIDFSIVGVAHSHPSGSPTPSTQDLNHTYGKIMIVVAFPYRDERDIAVYDNRAIRLQYQTTE